MCTWFLASATNKPWALYKFSYQKQTHQQNNTDDSTRFPKLVAVCSKIRLNIGCLKTKENRDIKCNSIPRKVKVVLKKKKDMSITTIKKKRWDQISFCYYYYYYSMQCGWHQGDTRTKGYISTKQTIPLWAGKWAWFKWIKNLQKAWWISLKAKTLLYELG